MKGRIRISWSDSRWRSSTSKPVWTNYSNDEKTFTVHIFNIKLEEMSYKISFKALPVKIQQSKINRCTAKKYRHRDNDLTAINKSNDLKLDRISEGIIALFKEQGISITIGTESYRNRFFRCFIFNIATKKCFPFRKANKTCTTLHQHPL